MSVAAILARFACGPSPTDTAARSVMRLSLYDWMACGRAGVDEPLAQILRAQAGTGPAPVFGGTAPSPALAAWVNGATSHALDYDDTHFAHIGHPSVTVFPAAMAVAGDGAAMIDAALMGAEASVRIGMWLGRGHYQVGFHQTATAGAFGATLAAGRLLGLSAPQMEAALGLAATQAAGLKSQFGTMGKPYHAGLAARTGVEAASLALAGFDTRGAGLDGEQGFGPTHHGAAQTNAFDGLGQGWVMAEVSHKYHACCHGLHAMLEALDDYLGQHRGQHNGPEPDGVIVHTHPRWLSVCNIAVPRSGLEVKFSYAMTAALALRGIDTGALDTYRDAVAQDESLRGLAAKVQVVADDSLPETATRVEVRLGSDSAVFAHDLAQAAPLDARSAKLREKGRALVAEEEALWQAACAKRAPDLDALLGMMGHGALWPT